MTDRPIGRALAISGSNLTGDAPYSVSLRLPPSQDRPGGDRVDASVPAGERGDLAVLCRQVCDRAGIRPSELEDVLIDVGPGSYTGLRVAVTFVRALAQFGGVRVWSVGSLALLAGHASVGVPDDVRRVRTLLDARRGRLHMACFGLGGNGSLEELEPSRAVARDEALAGLAVDDADELVVLSPALGEQVGDELSRRRRVHVATGLRADALFTAPLSAVVDIAELEPRYLMASYAEE